MLLSYFFIVPKGQEKIVTKEKQPHCTISYVFGRKSLTYIAGQQGFIEHLLCVKHCLGAEAIIVNNTAKVPAVMFDTDTDTDTERERGDKEQTVDNCYGVLLWQPKKTKTAPNLM